ncbi:MAG: hypothetical protein Q9166_006579 [cf. Caloplaca sp. 2 TL-2023]
MPIFTGDGIQARDHTSAGLMRTEMVRGTFGDNSYHSRTDGQLMFLPYLNPAAWSALTNSPDGQVAVEWCVDIHGSQGDSYKDAKTFKGVMVAAQEEAVPQHLRKTPRPPRRPAFKKAVPTLVIQLEVAVFKRTSNVEARTSRVVLFAQMVCNAPFSTTVSSRPTSAVYISIYKY